MRMRVFEEKGAARDGNHDGIENKWLKLDVISDKAVKLGKK